LVQVNQCAGAFTGNDFQGAVEHKLAVAQRSPENVAGQAMSVHADQHRSGCVLHITLDQGHVRFTVKLVLKRDHAEFTVAGGQHGFTNAGYMAFILHAVPDQLRNGQHFQAVFAAEIGQVRHARHGAVFIHDFADHTCWDQPSHPGQVD